MNAEFVFKCRNKHINFTKPMIDDIKNELNYLTQLRFTKDEINYISEIPYHKTAIGFLEFLRMYQLNPDYLTVIEENDNLSIRAKGPLFQVTMWEIYVLAIVQEVYWRHLYDTNTINNFMHKGYTKLLDDLKTIEPFTLVEFGTRRRFNKEYQEQILKYLIANCGEHLFGTSNVFLAMKYNIRSCGTMAHEYICLGQGLNTVPIAESQRYMLDIWSKEYDGANGTALTDTLGMDKWEKDFTGRFAKLFDGVRHDSGDPIVWGMKMLLLYKKFGIDATTKYFMFSDNLDLIRVKHIQNHFKDRVKMSFGIGTSLTNNIPGTTPLNNVMKMVSANNHPVAKISDEPGKTMCEDEKYLEYLRYTIK